MVRTVEVPNATPPAPGSAIRVVADGRVVAIFNVGGTLHAIDAACTHVEGPLERGQVAAGVVTCPLHGSQFEIATGKRVRGPAVASVKSYPVRPHGTGLAIDLD